jgi:hypothetical protein
LRFRDQRLDARGPEFQRRLALGTVLSAIVDAGDAGFVAVDVIQHNFDNVRRDPQASKIKDLIDLGNRTKSNA